MIGAHLRQDALVCALCLFVLALHAIPHGTDFIYFRTFLLGPAMASIGGYALGFYWKQKHAQVEREAQLYPPGFLARMLAPLSLCIIGITLFVVLHGLYVNSYSRLEWWPMVVGMQLGRNIGELVQISKSEP